MTGGSGRGAIPAARADGGVRRRCGRAKLPGAAERALLAQLLLTPGRTIPATMLVDRLWSESTLPVDPMNALQIRVSKLRRALKAVGVDDVVTREGVGLPRQRRPAQVDAVDFDRPPPGRARAAAHADADERVHPRPSAGLSTTRWRCGAVSRSATSRPSSGRPPKPPVWPSCGWPRSPNEPRSRWRSGRHLEVVGDLEPVVAGDPTLESLAGLLMVALYRSGRQADALEVYTRTREVLDESLGLEPSVSLRSLHERVLRQDDPSARSRTWSPRAAASPTGRRARPPARRRCRRTGPAPPRTGRRRRTCPPCCAR